jgi:hypothetical protein
MRISALLASIALAPAYSYAAEVRPLVVAGYDSGGDRIVNLTFTTGKGDSIRANEGLYVGGGLSVLNDARNLEFQGTLSVKYQGLHADNGSVRWTEVPLDALVFYRRQSFRLGGGMTYVMNPRAKGSDAASNIDMTFDNALGAVLQGDYLVEQVSLGLRYTLIDYKFGGTTVKGSGLGVSFGFAF